jgi:hypothetical protein
LALPSCLFPSAIIETEISLPLQVCNQCPRGAGVPPFLGIFSGSYGRGFFKPQKPTVEEQKEAFPLSIRPVTSGKISILESGVDRPGKSFFFGDRRTDKEEDASYVLLNFPVNSFVSAGFLTYHFFYHIFQPIAKQAIGV